MLGDTDAEAREIADEVRRAQVSGPHAIMFLEQLWNRDLSAYDPDGPLPEVDPDVDGQGPRRGQRPGPHAAAGGDGDGGALARAGRGRRPLDPRAGDRDDRPPVVRRLAATVAEAIDAHVQAEACDGFILIPHITPGGLDRFADEVVPLLQERGAFRTDYEGTTLRDHLGLTGLGLTAPKPARAG